MWYCPISSLMAWIEILKMNYPDDGEGLLVKVSVEKQKNRIAITIVMAIPFFYNMSTFSFLPDYLRQEFGDRFF